jgi:hypothetical protein
MEQTIFNWAIAAAGALGGWFLKVIWDMLREMRAEIHTRDTRLQDDLKKLDTKMHEDFVRRDDFKDAVKEIKDDMKAGFASVDSTLRLLFKKLDDKE